MKSGSTEISCSLIVRNGKEGPRQLAAGKSLPLAELTDRSLPVGRLSFYSYKEFSMSLPITAAGVASAFPAMNVHAHGHGHKKGLESATDSTSEPDAPTGSTQSLFGNLLDSMEQVIGAHSANAPTQPPGSTRPSGSAAHAAAAAQSAAATSSMGDAAKALLSTIGTALKFLA